MPASAAERFALIVSGVSGGAKYAQQQQQWETGLTRAFRESFDFEPDHVIVLAEGGAAETRATAANVRQTLSDLRRRLTRDDVLLVVLIGHGSFDGDVAKFNLVGPDLSAEQWGELLNPIAARLVLIDTTESSFPFLERLSQRGRIVITATDSAAQRFATVFPEYLLRSLTSSDTDVDKNGRVSVWELFASTSGGVREYYDQRGQLPTERPLLDDTGDQVGGEAGASGPDGTLARTVFIDADVMVEGTATVAALQRRRVALEGQLEALKVRKKGMPQDQYEAELERVLVDLAKVWRDIRKGSE